MEQDGKSTDNANQEMRQILSEFLAGVVKLEQLAELGGRFLDSFQRTLNFLRRPSIHESSELVKRILKENENNRVKTYVVGGCTHAYDSAQRLSRMKTSLSGLHDHLVEAKSTLSELEALMNKAGCSLQAECEDPLDLSELDLSENLEQEPTSERKENHLHKSVSLDAAGCASSMALIYSMVKQDYLMQERVVSSLGLKSSSEELDSYCQIWSLRPFINDDIIHEVINYIK